MPRIGRDLKPGELIKNDQIKNLFEVLREYHSIIKNYKVEKILVTATNAFRFAANSKIIVAEIKKQFSWDVNIISGKTESKYAFLGAVSDSSQIEKCLIIDIGGGSTELIFGKSNIIESGKSFQIGSVSATEIYLKHSPPDNKGLTELNIFLNHIFGDLLRNDAPDSTIAIAGTATTLACMVKGLKEYDDSLIEGSKIGYEELKNVYEILSRLTSNEIKDRYGNVTAGREDIILGGSVILLKIMNLLKLSEVIVSSRGIRYGAILYYLRYFRN
jgi:exopolyphosphatase/guanosine-5'-triphosphate,3'-diphosphate pyrophosphatase